ncbi:MAG TPA: metallophosphoesterase [Bryobacteraceae bacterium]|nr:metallophosphoesterase [Bryobacteraceae bacterium]
MKLLSFCAIALAIACPCGVAAQHFAILGDRTGGAEPGVYEQVMRELHLLSPDFVINAGDTIERRSSVPPKQQWTSIHDLWKLAGSFPFFMTPGNHDIYSDATEQIFEKQTGRHHFYSFTVGEVHVTVLDNSRTSDIEPAQLKFLEDDLSRNAASPVKIVTFHKPFWLPLLDRGDDSFPLHRIAQKFHVTAVISGHGHRFLLRNRGGLIYMEAGSAAGGIGTELKTEGFPGGWFYGFTWASVDSGKLHLSLKELGPPLGQGRLFPIEELHHEN